MKRESSRGIIIENNKVLTIFRRKKDELGNVKEYYVIPGGGIEEGETKEDTVKRELSEELGLDIKIEKYLGLVETEKTIEHYFKVKRLSGEPNISGEELDRMDDSNYYEPRFMDINELSKVNFNRMDMVIKSNTVE